MKPYKITPFDEGVLITLLRRNPNFNHYLKGFTFPKGTTVILDTWIPLKHKGWRFIHCPLKENGQLDFKCLAPIENPLGDKLHEIYHC